MRAVVVPAVFGRVHRCHAGERERIHRTSLMRDADHAASIDVAAATDAGPWERESLLADVASRPGSPFRNTSTDRQY
jgi:hypothetical protein